MNTISRLLFSALACVALVSCARQVKESPPPLVTAGAAAVVSHDPAMDAQVAQLANEWARIKYQVGDKSSQYHQLDALAKQAAVVVAHYPDRAEPLLWQGIATSEEAAHASVFKQLGLAKSARDILLKAAAIDNRAENGAVVRSLGVLYCKVPGFPLGFGSNDKARKYLEAALAIDPASLDSNFFYADFLASRGEYARSKSYLERALKAPPIANHPVWDKGRREEARALLAKDELHLAVKPRSGR